MRWIHMKGDQTDILGIRALYFLLFETGALLHAYRAIFLCYRLGAVIDLDRQFLFLLRHSSSTLSTSGNLASQSHIDGFQSGSHLGLDRPWRKPKFLI